MDKAMIVSDNAKSAETLLTIAKECGIEYIVPVNSVAKARKDIFNNEISIIIIDTPLSEASEFAFEATKTNAGIILLIAENQIDEFVLDAENNGVYIIKKPFEPTFLCSAIKLALSTNRRIVVTKTKNIEYVRKIEEIQLIDRAKYILIQNLSMTEAQAHRFIEKQAMDMRVNKITVAEGILKTYET